MKSRQLRDMIKVTDAAFMAAQAKLVLLRQQDAEIRDQLLSLRERRIGNHTGRPKQDDPALKAGADALWLQWIAKRQATLNAELAQLQVQKAQQFDRVKKAFGRRQTMRALLAKSQEDARMQRDRRATE